MGCLTELLRKGSVMPGEEQDLPLMAGAGALDRHVGWAAQEVITLGRKFNYMFCQQA